MPDDLQIQQLLAATLAAGVVVLAGAAYALLFALGKLHNRRTLTFAAYLAYGLLAIAVAVLVNALQLRGFWLFVSATMLLGYLLAPHGIWHLCVGTHLVPDEPGLRGATAQK